MKIVRFETLKEYKAYLKATCPPLYEAIQDFNDPLTPELAELVTQRVRKAIHLFGVAVAVRRRE